MTEKKSPNPFINLANQAKTNNPATKGKQVKSPKINSKGFGGTAVIRRSGRGG